MAGTTDTIPAKLTPGEFVIKREAVDMIGVPFLNKLNNMPDEGGGHTEIDKLISMASMEGMKNMYGGGMVEMMGGGMVKNKMMGYGHGGMVKSPIMGMQKGGMAKNLKPVPDDNPGLGKLPEMVRNRMGYMQDGGMVDDSLMGMMKGGMAKKKKGYGYQDGGMVGPPAPQRNEIMQPGQVPPGTVMGPSDADIEQLRMLRAMELKNSIEDSTVQKARDSLKLMGLLDSLRNNPQNIDILDNPDTLEGSPFLDNNIPSRGEMINKMMQMGYI